MYFLSKERFLLVLLLSLEQRPLHGLEVQYSAVQYCTVQYRTVQNSTNRAARGLCFLESKKRTLFLESKKRTLLSLSFLRFSKKGPFKRQGPHKTVQYRTVQNSAEQTFPWCLEHGFTRKVRNVP